MTVLPNDVSKRLRKYKIGIWIMTFIGYAFFHMNRKIYSTVKSSLSAPYPDGYAPFRGKSGHSILAALDTTFLVTYAIGLFFSGIIADHVNLRAFLALGLAGSALGIILWPLAYVLDIHNLGFFYVANIIAGIFQCIGWPTVVALMSTWFRGKRGLILGIWNANTSIGNILALILSAIILDIYDPNINWAYAFVWPSLLSIIYTIIIIFCLCDKPSDYGFTAYIMDLSGIDNMTHHKHEIIYNNNDNNINNNNINNDDECEELDPLNTGMAGHMLPVDFDQGVTHHHNNNTNETIHNLGHNHHQSSHNSRYNNGANNNTDTTYNTNHHQTSLVNRNNNNSIHDDDIDNDIIPLSHSQFHLKSQSACLQDYQEGSERQQHEPPTKITFCMALLVPGVIEFSLSLFFCKLVAYTFLFWLPAYLHNFYDDSVSAALSIWFDIGGILGGIMCGILADKTHKPGIITVIFMIICVPTLYIFEYISSHLIGGQIGLIIIMFILGCIVNGPYSLITTAVSADLGQHPELGKSKSALATICGIIDGFGTLGACFSGVVITFIAAFAKTSKSGDGKDDDNDDDDGEHNMNWNIIFIFLMVCAGLSALFLIRIFIRELREDPKVLNQPGHRPQDHHQKINNNINRQQQRSSHDDNDDDDDSTRVN